MRISDWSSDVCSSDLLDVDFVEYRLGRGRIGASFGHDGKGESGGQDAGIQDEQLVDFHGMSPLAGARTVGRYRSRRSVARDRIGCWTPRRSEEHTSELQSLMRISYAVFCL